MAKLKYGPGVIPIRNKHQGAVFQRNNYGQSIKSDSNGAKNRWLLQTQYQQFLMKAVRFWRDMSPTVKIAWSVFAANFPQPSKKDPNVFLSGYQLFLKRNHYCFLNHGIDCDFMTEPVAALINEPQFTFSISASDNSINVTELFIANFGILPNVGDFVLVRIIPMAVNSGQFFAPIEKTLQVDEVFIDGLFFSFNFSGKNAGLVFSVYLSRVVYQSTTYVGTKIRYMGCFTPKTFLALTDTPDNYSGHSGELVIVKPDEAGLVFVAPGDLPVNCEAIMNCGGIVSLLEKVEDISKVVVLEGETSIPAITHGLMYNHYAAAHSLLPSSADWRLPTRTEMESLYTHLGGRLVSGGKMKSLSYLRFAAPNTGASNSSKFFGASTGRRNTFTGAFENFNLYCWLWTSTFYSGHVYYTLTAAYDTAETSGLGMDERDAIGIRFVKSASGIPDGTQTFYKDNSGNIYRAVSINGLYWLQDNLRDVLFSDGTAIPRIISNNDFKFLTSPCFCVFDNDWTNV